MNKGYLDFGLIPTCDEVATTMGLKDGSYERLIVEVRELDTLNAQRFPFLRPHHIVNPIHLVANNLLAISDSDDHGALIVHAHQLASVTGLENPWTRVLKALGNKSNFIFSRYARSPAGAALLDSLYCSYAGELPEDDLILEQTQTSPYKPSQGICRTHKNWVLFFIRFTVDRFHGREVSSTPSSRLFLSRLERFRVNFNRSISKENSRKTEALKLSIHLECLIQILKHESPRQHYLSQLADMPWWRCEAEAAGVATGNCTKLKDGEEMMACGKCKSIRYCCREHQRAHWKKHKKSCWEPIW
ncbi:hypothetical protein BDY24DRAFT_395602 [Mrakia frigida]|uniref:zinc finger MYND domain-containing protein n=1 Tax=Mrakia frigida TaxID=29902 RepID=UPI003FCC126E